MTWLTAWLTNPLMLGIGAAAILSPIIIHLLNKRRFKIVEWAAMDFLFDADKKNRRRVKLENFILLLLRCLAMLLLGLLLARPFLPSGLSGALGNSQQFQRIILLDDSLSQRAKVGNKVAFDESKDRVKQLLQALTQDLGNDYLTLYVTSQPGEPLIANQVVNGDSISQLIAQVDELECSDKVADYSGSLVEIKNFVEEDRSNNNQVVYVLTDMRKRDWQDPGLLESENAPNKLLDQISQITPNTFIIDVGSTFEENLAVTNVECENLLVANTVLTYNVEVTNFGKSTAENVEILFRVDDTQPLKETIASIEPGRTALVSFNHKSDYDVASFKALDADEKLSENLINSRVHVEIVQQSATKDFLLEDSEAFFAARTLKAIPVLIVDGDPSANSERSESHYLRRLRVVGTGAIVDVKTATEFESTSLTHYKVIFICNVDQMSKDRMTSLKQWVNRGGGLVLMPGNRVRSTTFNESFFEKGEGLSPMKLEVVEGDTTRGSWVLMSISEPQHPALMFARDSDIGFDSSEIFSYWRGVVKTNQEEGNKVSTPLLLSNPDNSPAMADHRYGDGRVVTFAFPADADWTAWPAHFSYICLMLDLVNDLVGKVDSHANIQVGGDIKQLVDLSRFQINVALTDPKQEKIGRNARAIDNSESVLRSVSFENLGRRGFYELEFKKQDEKIVKQLWSVNVNTDESDMRRMDLDSLSNEFFGKETKLLQADRIALDNVSRSNNEIWPLILMLLAGLLALEQFLGWWFGRKR